MTVTSRLASLAEWLKMDPIRLQGTYYVVTGLWSVTDRRTFEAITGPKTDYWLVRTVGLLSSAIGSALLLASRRRHLSSEICVLAAGAGTAFTAVDVLYSARRRIAPIYLGDAIVHTALATWSIARARRTP